MMFLLLCGTVALAAQDMPKKQDMAKKRELVVRLSEMSGRQSQNKLLVFVHGGPYDPKMDNKAGGYYAKRKSYTEAMSDIPGIQFHWLDFRYRLNSHNKGPKIQYVDIPEELDQIFRLVQEASQKVQVRKVGGGDIQNVCVWKDYSANGSYGELFDTPTEEDIRKTYREGNAIPSARGYEFRVLDYQPENVIVYMHSHAAFLGMAGLANENKHMDEWGHIVLQSGTCFRSNSHLANPFSAMMMAHEGKFGFTPSHRDTFAPKAKKLFAKVVEMQTKEGYVSASKELESICIRGNAIPDLRTKNDAIPDQEAERLRVLEEDARNRRDFIHLFEEMLAKGMLDKRYPDFVRKEHQVFTMRMERVLNGDTPKPVITKGNVTIIRCQQDENKPVVGFHDWLVKQFPAGIERFYKTMFPRAEHREVPGKHSVLYETDEHSQEGRKIIVEYLKNL